jgi:hypothetical protein
MSELIILSLDRDAFMQLHKRALTGDQAALAALAALWDDYRDRSLACYL